MPDPTSLPIWKIQRSDLAEVVLLLHSLGIREAATFDWLDKPDTQAVERAERLLTMLGALLDADLTDIGRQMRRLPMHPRYSRMLIEASQRNCVPDAALCAALVSGRDLLTRLDRNDAKAQATREVPSRGPLPLTLLSLATAVKPAWVVEMFPQHLSTTVEHLFDAKNKRVAVMKFVRYQNLVIEQKSQQRDLDPHDSGRCLAEARGSGSFELPLMDHRLKQFIARVNLVHATLPELEFVPFDEAAITTGLATTTDWPHFLAREWPKHRPTVARKFPGHVWR